MNAFTGMASQALALLQDAAAAAYCTALGHDYDEKRGDILQEIASNFDNQGEDLKRLIARATAAGLTKRDPNFVAQMMAVFATDMALRAAAKHCGEPKAPAEAEETKPEGAAVH